LKVKPKRGWVKVIKDRLLSSSLIVVFGFLSIVSLILNGILLTLNNFLKNYFPEVTIIFFQILNVMISFGVITILFGIIFKVLPDAKIEWKDVRIGALFTAFLFTIGHLLIGLYIQSSSTGNAYGAAGSLIIILVWVYYTATILYFGAEFTKVYIEHVGSTIRPAQYAVFVEEHEVELKP
jgi:membrane protein